MNDTAMGILVSGGPAPGINGVIAAATIEARKRGWRVVGLHDGYEHLALGRTDAVRPLDIDAVSRIHLTGGSVLGTSRVSPARDRATTARVVDALGALGIDRLVSIGGDGSAYSAFAVGRAAGDRVRVVHVPKTIDNDLPLPDGQPTFGFRTACHEGARALRTLAVDAKTTRRWYLAVAMGRTAGHLALGIAKAAGATLAILPEELADGVPLAFVRDTVLGSMLKRLAAGRPFGTVVVAEGVVHRIRAGDLAAGPTDSLGRPRASQVPIGRALADAVAAELHVLGVELDIVPVDIGYAIRCAEPIADDLQNIRDLGYGAVAFLAAGGADAVITADRGQLATLPLASMVDAATGRVKTRLVDLAQSSYRIAREYMIRLEPTDLDAPALDAFARAARLDPDAARRRFGPVADPRSPHRVALPAASWPFGSAHDGAP